jgi:hypothetical protein
MAVRRSYWQHPLLSKFAASALLACTLSHVMDPQTEKMVWLIKCSDGVQSAYIAPTAVKRKGAAMGVAKRWLNSRRPKFTVSVQELKAEHK